MSFKKNFIKFEESIDFNFISKILSLGDHESFIASRWNASYILESVFQIRNIQDNNNGFKKMFDELNKKYNLKKYKSDLDIFYSLISGTRSNTHRDSYHVYIIGAYGRTLYKVEDKEYIVGPGDLLHIAPYQLHTAIGIDPRIIMSFGVRNNVV